MAAVGLILPMAEGEHFPPTPGSFWQPLFAIPGTDYAFTRPMLLIAISGVVLALWLWLTTRHAAVVPGRGQWYTEQVYNFARNGIARDMIGSKEFMRFVPFLFSLFVFILLNNLFGVIPGFQNPTMARIGFPIGLNLIVYVMYHWVGLRKAGSIGAYLGGLLPSGLPGWIKPMIMFLELITFFITRPLTLALRLFGNMFAGHMLIVLFVSAGAYFLTQDVLFKLLSVPTFIMAAVMFVFEALVQFLQAYVFVLLSASYIAGALADDH